MAASCGGTGGNELWGVVGPRAHHRQYYRGLFVPPATSLRNSICRRPLLGVLIQPGDNVLLTPEEEEEEDLRRVRLPYIGRVEKLWRDLKTGRGVVRVRWFYRPMDIPPATLARHRSLSHAVSSDEIFLSNQRDNNDVDAIVNSCTIAGDPASGNWSTPDADFVCSFVLMYKKSGSALRPAKPGELPAPPEPIEETLWAPAPAAAVAGAVKINNECKDADLTAELSGSGRGSGSDTSDNGLVKEASMNGGRDAAASVSEKEGGGKGHDSAPPSEEATASRRVVIPASTCKQPHCGLSMPSPRSSWPMLTDAPSSAASASASVSANALNAPRIRIGEEFNAAVPELLENPKGNGRRRSNNPSDEAVQFLPARLEPNAVDAYLNRVRTLKPVRDVNGDPGGVQEFFFSDFPEPVALKLLHDASYDVDVALERIQRATTQIRDMHRAEVSTMGWSFAEETAFAAGIRTHKDNLHRVAALLPTKSLPQIISYYYKVWNQQQCLLSEDFDEAVRGRNGRKRASAPSASDTSRGSGNRFPATMTPPSSSSGSGSPPSQSPPSRSRPSSAQAQRNLSRRGRSPSNSPPLPAKRARREPACRQTEFLRWAKEELESDTFYELLGALSSYHSGRLTVAALLDRVTAICAGRKSLVHAFLAFLPLSHTH